MKIKLRDLSTNQHFSQHPLKGIFFEFSSGKAYHADADADADEGSFKA